MDMLQGLLCLLHIPRQQCQVIRQSIYLDKLNAIALNSRHTLFDILSDNSFNLSSCHLLLSSPESPRLRSPTAPLVHHHKSGSVASDAGIGNSPLSFSYNELYNMTNGFSPQNILGEGGFGCVYKGRLPDGKEIAAKQLKVGSGQGEREFKAEVEIISRVHHRHLVSLVGYCISDNQRLLVYDFVPNGSLDSHLHGMADLFIHVLKTKLNIIN